MGVISKFLGFSEGMGSTSEKAGFTRIPEASEKERQNHNYPPTSIDPDFDIHDVMARQAMFDLLNKIE